MPALTYKCPNCEGPLSWDAKKKSFICEYCDSVFTREFVASMEADEGKAGFKSAEEAAATGSSLKGAARMEAEGKVKVYNCPSCGAVIAGSPTFGAGSCFYCGNPVVLSEKFEGTFNPDSIIPFAIDKEKAVSIFKSWLSRHRYVPTAFYKNRIDELNGVYFPYWVYSARLNVSIKGEGKEKAALGPGMAAAGTVSVYEVEEQGELDIKNVSHAALKGESRRLSEAVMPFRMEEAVSFNQAYLQGYIAEVRDMEKDDVKGDIEEEIREFAKEKVSLSAYSGYESVEVKEMSLKTISEETKYCLFPVWTLTYKAPGGEIYYFSINGQTGKTCGVLPVDNMKLLKLFFTVAVPLLAILLLFFYFII